MPHGMTIKEADTMCVRLANKLSIEYAVVKKAFDEMVREDVKHIAMGRHSDGSR